MRRRMSELGLTQTDIALRTKLTANHVNHFCHGRRCPNVLNLLKLAKALSVEVGWLCGSEE